MLPHVAAKNPYPPLTLGHLVFGSSCDGSARREYTGRYYSPMETRSNFTPEEHVSEIRHKPLAKQLLRRLARNISFKVASRPRGYIANRMVAGVSLITRLSFIEPIKEHAVAPHRGQVT